MNTIRTPEDGETLVQQSLGEMSVPERARLEQYAASLGITPEAAVVQIVERAIKAGAI
ncbi:hypothetical protein LJR071_003523 [Pseudomonas sp. LjRoot71]|uniref:hypothetical protein n=1 Tax=Pseudomonas sp. LjRoot71 TaxID=3342336 RepID=UPI003ECF2996